MSDLSFNEDPSLIPERNDGAKSASFITGLVLKYGLARNERGATILLGSVAVVLIFIAILLWFVNQPSTNSIPSSELLRQAQQPQYLP